MQQPPQAEHPRYSRDAVHCARIGDRIDNSDNPGDVRSTTYQGIEIGGNSRAHFGDSHQQNHGLVISTSLRSPTVEVAELTGVDRC